MNRDIKSWFILTQKVLKQQFDLLEIKHVKRSPSPVSSKETLMQQTRMRSGLISRGSFKFNRSMVFVSKGVGKGVPAALAGTSATTRKPKDWFNSVIDNRINNLADTVAGHCGDIVCSNIRIK